MDGELLDQYLRKALIHLKESSNPDKGPVAAGIVTEDEAVYAVSERREGKWLHAERNAVEKFRSEVGRIPGDAALVVTLSPCTSKELSRHGISCTRLLKGEDDEHPVKIDRVHVGIIDQGEASYSDYVDEGFNITRTGSPLLREFSRKLNGFFETEDNSVTAPEHVEKVLASL